MCGFIAQLVEHHTGIVEVTGSNPFEALIFFFRLLLSSCLKGRNLISDPTEHFSKLIYVREILFHRPYESCGNSNTDIEELFSRP